MKKSISTFLIALILTNIVVMKPAKAAMVLGTAMIVAPAIYYKHATTRDPDYFRAPGHMIMSFGIGAGISCLAIPATVLSIMFLNWPLAILAEDGSLEQDQLESVLTEKYPFIGDREVILELATSIKNKYATIEKNTQEIVLVSMSEAEVKNILAPTDLSNEDISQVVEELK